LSPLPIDNQYRVLIESLESFTSWFDSQSKMSDTEDGRRYAVTNDGRRYMTSLPGRAL
jgi:hypothetical protein